MAPVFLRFMGGYGRKYRVFSMHIHITDKTFSAIKWKILKKSTRCCIVDYDEGILSVRIFHMTKKRIIDKITP